MSVAGKDSQNLLVRARSVLLDAIEALGEQRESLIVIGAQAVYLRAGEIDVPLAEATKDSDVAIDPRSLAADPLVETAMRDAGFLPSANNQPGGWVSADGIPVDLMVPEALAGGKGKRSADIPPHDRMAMRRAKGLEAALIDCDEMEIASLDDADKRVLKVKVAGAAALLVAKLHKIGERIDTPDRLNDKDAHDTYRIFQAYETDFLADSIQKLLADDLSKNVTEEALARLQNLFADGPQSMGAEMAGRAEEGVGEPEIVSQSVSILASDLLLELARRGA